MLWPNPEVHTDLRACAVISYPSVTCIKPRCFPSVCNMCFPLLSTSSCCTLSLARSLKSKLSQSCLHFWFSEQIFHHNIKDLPLLTKWVVTRFTHVLLLYISVFQMISGHFNITKAAIITDFIHLIIFSLFWITRISVHPWKVFVCPLSCNHLAPTMPLLWDCGLIGHFRCPQRERLMARTMTQQLKICPPLTTTAIVRWS